VTEGQARRRGERINVSTGERHGRCKLTDHQVREVLAWAAEGWPKTHLAHAFGVTRQYVHQIVRGEARPTVSEEGEEEAG